VPSNPTLDGQVSIELLTYVGAPPALGMRGTVGGWAEVELRDHEIWTC
jgi:hypothetical protein